MVKEKLPYLRIVCNYSESCNFHCKWCHQEGVFSGGQPNLLTPEEIQRVGKWFFDYGVRKFKVLGGEPTARVDLARIIALLRQLDSSIDISIVTNGSLLSENIDAYRQAGLTRVNVSLFSLNETYFESNVGNVILLNKTIEGIKKAAAQNMVSKINHIYHTMDDLIDVVNLAREYGIRVNLLNQIPNHPEGKFVSIEEITNAVKDLGVANTYIEDDEFSLPVRVYILTNGAEIEVKHLEISQVGLFHSCAECGSKEYCKEGIFAVRLTPDGCIRPCLVRSDNQLRTQECNYDDFVKYMQDL